MAELKDLIAKKSNEELSAQDFADFVSMIQNNKLSERQIVDFATTLNNCGCSDKEVYYLANAFADSGLRLKLSEKFGICVDKHSAGKVSDGMSLILMSVFACAKIPFVKTISSIYGMYGSMMSRLLNIDGFKVAKTQEEAENNAKKCGVYLFEDNSEIAPASAKFYMVCKKHNLLCEPVVSSTIMSNKIATGASVLVVDVKAGEGSVVDSAASERIAQRIVNIGNMAGIKTISIVTDLSWPISTSVGMKLELQEIKDLLSGNKDYEGSSLMNLSREMFVCTLIATEKCRSRTEATSMFNRFIENGEAYQKFCEIVECYGGDIVSEDRLEMLLATAVSYICAKKDGYISDIKLDMLYDNVNHIISQKNTKDNNAGLVLMCKEGDRVVAGQKLAKVFYSHENKRYFEVVKNLIDTFEISETKPVVHKLFYKVVV